VVVSGVDSLFEHESFTATGLALFPSLHMSSAANPIWSVIGASCRDGFTSSAVLAVVHKSRAWRALHVAVHLMTAAYATMINGNDDVMRIAAIAADTRFAFIGGSHAVGALYDVQGERGFCAHSVVHSVNDIPLVITNLNAQVAPAGASLETVACYTGVVAVAQDESLVSAIMALHEAAPSMAEAGPEPNFCSIHMTDAQIQSYVRSRPAEWIVMDRFSTGEMRDIVITEAERVTNCGDWFRCGLAYNDDTRMKWINVSAIARGASIDVRTRNARNRGLGNDTYIQVTSSTGWPSDCDYPVGSSTETHVSFFNLARGTWALIGVAWSPRLFRSLDIVLTVRMNGPIRAEGDEPERPVLSAF